MNLRLAALLRPKYTLLQSNIHTIATVTVQIQIAEPTLSYGAMRTQTRNDKLWKTKWRQQQNGRILSKGTTG
jgi:hypothetical protein